MASKLSLPSALPWSWVIEALSSSNQLDTSLLIDIVKKAPENSNDLGENAREMVSLRILESLSAKGNLNNNNDSPAQGRKTELDPSNVCEDVLRKILEEMSATGPEMVDTEMLNWDVESFVVHKRASLPIRALQKLKDAILEGSYSVLASLKERSGLSVRTQCDNNIPLDGGNSSGLAQRLEEISRYTEVTTPNGKLSSSTTQYRDNELQENFPDRNVLPDEGNTAPTTAENLEIQTYEEQTTFGDGSTPEVEAAEKFKQDSNFTGGIIVENSVASPVSRVLPCTSKGVDGYIEKEGCNLEKEVEVTSSTPQNRDDKLPEILPDRNLLPAKRNRAAATAQILGRQTCEDQITLSDGCGPHEEAVKKFKQDSISAGQNFGEDSMASPMHGLRTISSEGVVEHIESEGCNLEREVQVGGMECDGSPHDGDYQHAASKRLAEIGDAFRHDHLLYPLQVPTDENKVAEFPPELHDQNNGVDEANEHTEGFERRESNGISLGVSVIEKRSCLEDSRYDFQGNFNRNASSSGEAKDDMEHNPDLGMASDTDEYHDERMDIALKKDAFLSSQCTYSQDSMATQQKYCVKCNKDGQLLVCNSKACQLVVHESCLCSAVSFDGNGKFYCPFCAYSQAISEYMQVKKKASLARNDLGTFIGSKSEFRPKKVSMRSSKAKQNQLRENDDSRMHKEGKNDEDFVAKVSNSHCRENVKKHQAEPPISCPRDNPLFGEKMVDLTDGMPQILVKRNLERKDMGQECQSPRGQVEHEIAAQSVHNSDSDCREPDIINKNVRKAGTRRKKVSNIPGSALPHEPVCGPITESSEEHNEKPATSNYSIRLRKPMKHYTYPAIPQLRRKILPWTKVEEEKLKEGVERLSSPHDRVIPWKKILEFGGDVFQKGRTSIDLKDKWRNICKGSPISK